MNSCPDLDRLVDAALAGRPGAADRLDAHAASCAACAADAALADTDDAALAEAVACLRAPVCPPAVLDAALALARTQAPDRAAVPSDRGPSPGVRAWPRAGLWKVAAPALAAVAALVWAVSGPATDPATGPLAAVQTPVPSLADPARRSASGPAPSPILSAPLAEPDAPAPPAPPAAGRPVSVPPVPDRPETRPAPAAATPPDLPPLMAATPSTANSVAARDGVYLALELVGRAQRAADAAFSDELQRVSTALEPTRIL